MREPMRPFVFGLNDEDLIIYNPKSISGGTRGGEERGLGNTSIRQRRPGRRRGIEYKTL